MGHANVKNLSEFFVRRLYAKGRLSLREALKVAMKKGLTLNASEGAYDDEGMVGMGLEVVVMWLHWEKKVIEPCHPLTPRQQRAITRWDPDEHEEDPESDDYKAFDSIAWRFAKGWRRKYPELPLLHYYEN
jgi:hypothetical protein